MLFQPQLSNPAEKKSGEEAQCGDEGKVQGNEAGGAEHDPKLLLSLNAMDLVQ